MRITFVSLRISENTAHRKLLETVHRSRGRGPQSDPSDGSIFFCTQRILRTSTYGFRVAYASMLSLSLGLSRQFNKSEQSLLLPLCIQTAMGPVLIDVFFIMVLFVAAGGRRRLATKRLCGKRNWSVSLCAYVWLAKKRARKRDTPSPRDTETEREGGKPISNFRSVASQHSAKS